MSVSDEAQEVTPAEGPERTQLPRSSERHVTNPLLTPKAWTPDIDV
jgi:hypothetical protein